MRKYFLLVLIITVSILACNENKKSNEANATSIKSKKKKFSKDDLKVIEEAELLKALQVEIPEGMLMTGANNIGNVYHSQFESTKDVSIIRDEFRKILDSKLGSIFDRIESKNPKFKPWEKREVGQTIMYTALYVYKNKEDVLNVKVATNSNRGSVLVYLGKAKIY